MPAVIVHTKTHCSAERCFQMPSGALGPGLPPRALPLPKNPEEYRKNNEIYRRIPKNPEKKPENTEKIPGNPKKSWGKFALPSSASETRAMIRKPTNTTGWNRGNRRSIGCLNCKFLLFEQMPRTGLMRIQSKVTHCIRNDCQRGDAYNFFLFLFFPAPPVKECYRIRGLR